MDITVTLLLAVVCIAIGFLLAGLVNSLRGRNAGGKAAQSEVHVQTGASSSTKSTPAGVRLWRDAASQELKVELEGQPVQEPARLSASQRGQLDRLARNLLAWLKAIPENGSPEELTAELTADEEKLQPQVPLEEISSAETRGRQDNWPPAGGVEASAQQPAEQLQLSMAAQIDAILQSKLAGTALAKRGVRLVELPGQEVALMIGLEKYTDLEAIPDPEIRSAIRAAVAEWETRHAG